MKNKIIVLIIFFALPVFAFSQKQNSISINTLNPILSAASLEFYRLDFKYERFIGNKFSLISGISYGQFYGHGSESSCYYELTEINYTGLAIWLEMRRYLKKDPFPNGLLFGIYSKNNIVNEDYYFEDWYDTVTVNENHFLPGIGFSFGYRIAKKKFYIEPVLGYGICINSTLGTNEKINSTGKDPFTWPFFARIECNIGFSF